MGHEKVIRPNTSFATPVNSLLFFSSQEPQRRRHPLSLFLSPRSRLASSFAFASSSDNGDSVRVLRFFHPVHFPIRVPTKKKRLTMVVAEPPYTELLCIRFFSISYIWNFVLMIFNISLFWCGYRIDRMMNDAKLQKKMKRNEADRIESLFYPLW